MKMKKVHITFEKRMNVDVCIPEDMTEKEIEALVEEVTLDGLRNWDEPDWDAFVGRVVEIEVPDAELKLGPPNKYGFRLCLSPTLRSCLVVDDERKDLVDPSDAQWWAKE